MLVFLVSTTNQYDNPFPCDFSVSPSNKILSFSLLRLRYNLGSGLTIRILVKLKINYGDLSLKLVNMIEQVDGGKFVEGCQIFEKDTNNLDT